jgi:hypothetical protein
MREYEYEDGGGSFVSINECSECGASKFRESRIPGVCVECLSPSASELEPGVWTRDLGAVEGQGLGLVYH